MTFYKTILSKLWTFTLHRKLESKIQTQDTTRWLRTSKQLCVSSVSSGTSLLKAKQGKDTGLSWLIRFCNAAVYYQLLVILPPSMQQKQSKHKQLPVILCLRWCQVCSANSNSRLFSYFHIHLQLPLLPFLSCSQSPFSLMWGTEEMRKFKVKQ